MYHPIRYYLKSCISGFDAIPAPRQELLKTLSKYIRLKYEAQAPVSLIYICTHNSRRSHFGQVAGALAAAYYAIEDVFTYSGGTEATALNLNAKHALDKIGLRIESDHQPCNPKYTMFYGREDFVTCYSKMYDDPTNPHKNFTAIMTCSDADENCPFIPGAEIRIAITYEDPKKSDGSPEQEWTYDQRLRQITTEMMYAFSLV